MQVRFLPGALRFSVNEESIDTCDTTCDTMCMLRTYLYIPDNMQAKIMHVAKKHNKSKAETIRRVLETGLDALEMQENTSTDVLMELARIGEKYKLKGPKDLSSNLDAYLWGEK